MKNYTIHESAEKDAEIARLEGQLMALKNLYERSVETNRREIESLRAENDRRYQRIVDLTEALRPFARAYRHIIQPTNLPPGTTFTHFLELNDWRTAESVLTGANRKEAGRYIQGLKDKNDRLKTFVETAVNLYPALDKIAPGETE